MGITMFFTHIDDRWQLALLLLLLLSERIVRIKYRYGIELKGEIEGTNQVKDEKRTNEGKENIDGNPIT